MIRRALTLLLIAPAMTLAGSAGAAANTCGAPSWVAAWTAAPTDGLAGLPAIEQTYRVQVRPAAAGDRVRLRLSNRYGVAPVTFGRVTLGEQASGPALVPGSMREVRFDGRTSVRVPKGADVLSDPVGLPARPDRPLLVSVHVTGLNAPPTQHVLGSRTGWQSPPLTGDRTRQVGGSGFIALPLPGITPAVPQGIPYVSGLDVEAVGTGAVVAFGDSITDGFQGTLLPVLPAAEPIDLDARYPDALQRRVLAAGLPISVVNAGISGNQLLKHSVVPIFGRSGLSRLDADALDLPGVSSLILMEGINDIGQSLAGPASLIAGYTEAIERAHARGIRVLLGTLTPDEGTLQPGYGVFGEVARATVNAWIRTQDLSDGVVDFDAAVRDPAHPTRILPAYDGGDHLHFSPAGYAAMADAVPLDQLAAWTRVSCR